MLFPLIKTVAGFASHSLNSLGYYTGKYFPTPKYFKMKSVGVDINDDAIRVIEFGELKGKVFLKNFGVKKLPKNVIVDGEIMEKKILESALRSLRNEMSLEFVNVSLPDEKSFLFQTQISKFNLKEMRQSVEFKLEENVPISHEDSIFEFDVLREINKSEFEINVAVYPKKTVETYTESILNAELIPIGYSPFSQAIADSIIPQYDLATNLVIYIGKTKSVFFVVSNRKILFSTVALIGCDTFISSVSRTFSLDANEAEKMIIQKGFINNKENKEMFFSVVNIFSVLKDEINKIKIFWETHINEGVYGGGSVENGRNNIKKIFLLSKYSSLPGFKEYLSIQLNNEIVLANVWTNSFLLDDVIPKIPYNESFDYAAAIGLSLQNI